MSMTPTCRPMAELLESRDLLAGVQAYLAGSCLFVLGTPSSDYIQVSQYNNQISVSGTPISGGNSQQYAVSASSLSKVIVYGYDSNDYIDLSTVKLDANIYAGDGNDTVRCGAGNDVVSPGNGFDPDDR